MLGIRRVMMIVAAAAMGIAAVVLLRTARIAAPPREERVLATTDAARVAEHLAAAIRFQTTSVRYEPDWMVRAHGTDERISVQGLADGVRFYIQLIRNSEQSDRSHFGRRGDCYEVHLVHRGTVAH